MRHRVPCWLVSRYIQWSYTFFSFALSLSFSLYSSHFDCTINTLRLIFLLKNWRKTKFGTYLFRERFLQLIEARYSSSLTNYDYSELLSSKWWKCSRELCVWACVMNDEAERENNDECSHTCIWPISLRCTLTMKNWCEAKLELLLPRCRWSEITDGTINTNNDDDK